MPSYKQDLSKQIEISIVVPVFQGEKTLNELFERLKTVIEARTEFYEVIFVHDGGSGASWTVLQELYARNPDRVKVVRLSKNYGQNAATICGLELSKGQEIVSIDEDLQTPPEEISRLLDKSVTGEYELLYGIPEKGKQSLFRRVGSSLTKQFFERIEGIDIGSSFRWFSRSLVDRMKQPATEHLFINQVATWYTNRIGYVLVQNQPRAAGNSGYSFLGLAKISLRLILFYSDFPLRVMIYFGLIVSLICLGFGGYYLYEKFVFGAVLGFTSIIVAIFFSTGLVITCFSIIGLYIKRLFKNQMGRPVYAIEKVLE